MLTILILVGMSWAFLFSFLPNKLHSDPYEDIRHSFSFSFLSVSYSCCILLCFWALGMTIIIGPGYSRQVFKSVCLDPITNIGADDVSQPSDKDDGEAQEGENDDLSKDNDGVAADAATQKSGSGNSANPNDAEEYLPQRLDLSQLPDSKD